MWAETEMLAGSAIAGWATFGLAGLILMWLFFRHLPDKDKQLEKLLAAHQDHVTTKDIYIRALMDTHKSSLDQKDGQIERMLAAKNEQIKILTQTGTEQIKTMMEGAAQQRLLMHEENQKALERVIKHCESEMKQTNEMLQQDLGQLSQAVEDLTTEIRDLGSRRILRRPQPPASGPEHAGG